MRLRRALAALGVAFAWAFAAQAYDYNGVTVTAENGSIREIGDELLVTFNQVGTGKLTLDGYALVRVMVVGGGGSGSTGRKATSGTGLDYRGNGGSGGEAIEYDNHYLAAGAYEVAVGAGGAAVTPGSTSNRTAGKSGGQSSFAGIVAKGGAGGVKENGSQNGTGNNTVMGWGSNLKTDISGETLTYSTGGAAATSATKAGSKGADRGCGGDGGGRTSDYKSGAGGKGIVIVRIKAASANPPATASFDQFVQYVEGVAVSPFDSIPPWAATITGTTNSTQRGHFSFTVSLKDGYVWSDTFGREDRTFKWAVVDDPAKGDTYLDVTKGVRADSSNPSNATISIIGHVPSEKVAVNVLFMGTMCYAHSLKPTTIQAAINSIAERASVDWYLFHKQALVGNTGILRDYKFDVASTIPDSMIHTNLSGSVAKGGVIDDNFVRNELDRQMQSNNHQALNSFMELLYEVSTDPARSKKYDYIVLEFDGSRVANDYTTYAHEAEVAAFLKPYYDAKKVVWLVDNCAANAEGGNLEPYKDNYYRPCTYFHNGHSTQIYEDSQYRGLLALVAPDCYDPQGTIKSMSKYSKSWTPKTKDGTSDYYRVHGGTDISKVATETVYATDSYDIQIPYDDADRVSDYLSLAIKEKPYDLEFVDKIVDSGLEITAAHMSTSNVERTAADLNWLDVTDPSVVSIDINQAAHKVNAVVSNMCSEVWAKLDIDVRDTGSFRTGEDPFTDEDLGRLVATKDPNDGNGSVFKYDPGEDEPTAQGESPTLEPWKYNVYAVTGLVVNGTLKIDGIETNEAFKAEGYDCSVTYRGDPGYALDSITVDGTPLTADEINEHLSDYGFTNIKADHEVVVVYTNFVVTSEPYTNYYDGAEHTIGVQLPDYHDDITDVKVQYSTDGETYVDTPPVYSNAGHTVVHYKVVGHQAGYGDEEIALATGFDTVDILPREVNVTAKSARKFYDGEELTAGYEVQHEYSDDLRAEGWGFVGTDDITTVKMTGESVIGADAAKTEKQTAQNVVDQSKTRFTSDEIAGNYIVHYTDGELEVIPVAVKPVVKVYDGAPTNVEVTVTDPPAGTTIRYSYAEDGGYVEAGELTFTGPTNAWESADVWVEVSAPGYGAVTNRAAATILPRVVVEQAGSDTKAYDGERLVCSNAMECADLEAAKAAEVYEARGYTADFPEIDPADAAGFAEGEGFVAAADGNTYLRMTDDSWRIDVGTTNNVIEKSKIESELAAGTSYGNYLFFFEDGELVVTNGTLTVTAFPAEKFYDGDPTNITFTVKDPDGNEVDPDEVYFKGPGDEKWIPAEDFHKYTNATNFPDGEGVPVEVKVVKENYTDAFAESTVTVWPRPVILVAATDAKVWDGEPLTNWTCTVKNDATTAEIPGYGFVNEDGVEKGIRMTPESTQTEIGVHSNVIVPGAEVPTGTTDLRNYTISYEPGSLLVVGSTPYVGEYDAKGHTITVTVPEIPGVDPDKVEIGYSLSETGPFESADEIPWTDVVEGKKVYYQVTVKGTGYPPVVGESTIDITPVPVVIVSNSGEKAYDGKALTNWTGVATITTNGVTTTFDVGTEVPLLGDDVIDLAYTGAQTEVGSSSNTFDYAFRDEPKSANYTVTTNYGELVVTPAALTVEAFPAEKFYDSVPTNIIVMVAGVPSGVTPTYEYSYSETEGYVPAADFTGPTNVSESAEIWCRVIIPGTTNTLHATATIKPRIVVSHAKDGEWTFNGEEHAQPDYFEDADDEAERSKAKWGTDEALPDSTGFVEGEGYADDLVMTGASRITNPGTVPNVIDTAVDKTALKPNTKAENYELYYLDGTLTVTPAAFTASAEPVEKFYDSVPTNIIVMVAGVPSGVTPTYEYSYSETEGYVPAADFTGPTNVSETAEVYCRVSIPGTTNVVSAVATIKPRIVVSHAKDGEWTFNGEEHAQPDYFEDADDEAERSKAKWGTDEALPDSTGFVEGEGYADDLVMTGASRITNPGTVPNVIDTAVDKTALKPNTKAENYELYYLDGTLTVTPAAFTASAEPVEKFYDSVPTNIAVTVAGVPSGVTPTYEYSYSETDGFVPAADFTGPTNVSETAEVWCRVIIPGTTNVVSATATIKPRIVVSHAKDGEWAFNGEEHKQPDSFEDEDAEAEKSKAKWGTDEVLPGSTGFVDGEGYAADLVMTDASRITNPGTKPNVIDTAADKTALKPNTKAENYELYYLDGTLTVTPATMGIEAFDAEKFYDADPTNITYVVTNAQGVAITDAVISLREKGTDEWIPVADFVPYVDTTNVIVEVKAEKNGFTPVTAEATVLVKPRPVTLVAASDSKTYDGLPLTNWTFTVKADTTTPGYGFVKDEGVSKVTMTDDSTVTLPGSQPNVIATTVAKPDTKLERNYVVSTEPGTLTVIPAVFTVNATPYDEFYDGQEHTIDVEVQKPEEAGEATITYSYAEGGTYLPIEDFEQLKDVTAGGPVTVYAKVEIEGYATVVVNATVNIKPRIVVEQADSASKVFDGLPLVQPNHYEEISVEAAKSKEKWGTVETLANSTGFVAGEGFADVPMTAGSTITEPGAEDNVIDAAAVTLLDGTKPGNYIFFYLPGELTVIQRQEEVRRDPEVEIPEESKRAVEESDKKIEKTLDEMAKADQEISGAVYVKYQLTVTPTNSLSEATRTTPEKAAEDAKEQVELAESKTGSKIDKVEFVDIVLERTYSKEEAEATAAGSYNKDNWEPLDKAEEHGNTLFEVVVPVEVPEGMELIGVTRSCDNKGTEILKPRDPNNPDAEGFIYDPETKTVTLYAYDFCVFGFMMQEKTTPPSPPHGGCGCEPEDEKPAACVYQFKANLYTTKGVVVRNPTARYSPCDPSSASPCLVMRGRDKTVLEGWIYDCTCTCGALQNAKAVIWDSVRKVQLADVEFSTDLQNIIGTRQTDAEWVWTLKGAANHDAVRAQNFEMTGAGYGAFERPVGRFSWFSGAVAGTASASYDLTTRFRPEIASCICEPSSVLNCDSVSSLDFIVEDTVVFGKWKVKYNAAASATYEKTGRLKLPNYVKW